MTKFWLIRIRLFIDQASVILRWSVLFYTTVFLLECHHAYSSRSFQIHNASVSEPSISRGGCQKTLIRFHQAKVSPEALSDRVKKVIGAVEQFRFIREEAKERGLRVWLFGGTAAGLIHYARLDLARVEAIILLQPERFDPYEFTEIYRSTQDLDIVVDGDLDQASEFQKALSQKFPQFLGNKGSRWEVRSLRQRRGEPGKPGFKEALLEDFDFQNQNTDTNSIGMIELTGQGGDEFITDVRSFGKKKQSDFLSDSSEAQIRYLVSDRHFETSRASRGQNPPILSVIRLLVKTFQYELTIEPESYQAIEKIISSFDPNGSELQNPVLRQKLEENAKKLVWHAVNIEYGMEMLEALGLRSKLIEYFKDHQTIGSAGWWLDRKALPSFPVGQGSGKTAKELGIEVVAHGTGDFLFYESINRAHDGRPNVLMSRKDVIGESAALGEGFYTVLGRGGYGRGLDTRFRVDPEAREGSDFSVHGYVILFHNKEALRTIYESMTFTLKDFKDVLAGKIEFRFDDTDLALIEKLKRKLDMVEVEAFVTKYFSNPDIKDSEKVDTLSRITQTGLDQLFTSQVKSLLDSFAINFLNDLLASGDLNNHAKAYRYLGAFRNVTDIFANSQNNRWVLSFLSVLGGYSKVQIIRLLEVLQAENKRSRISMGNVDYLEAFLKILKMQKDIQEEMETQDGDTPLSREIQTGSLTISVEKSEQFEVISRLTLLKAIELHLEEVFYQWVTVNIHDPTISPQSARNYFEIVRRGGLIQEGIELHKLRVPEERVDYFLTYLKSARNMPSEIRVIALDYVFEYFSRASTDLEGGHQKATLTLNRRFILGQLVDMDLITLIDEWGVHLNENFDGTTPLDRKWRKNLRKVIFEVFPLLKDFRNHSIEARKVGAKIATKKEASESSIVMEMIDWIFRFYYDPQPARVIVLMRGERAFAPNLEWILELFKSAEADSLKEKIIIKLIELGATDVARTIVENLELEFEGDYLSLDPVEAAKKIDQGWVAFRYPRSRGSSEARKVESIEIQSTLITKEQWNQIVRFVLKHQPARAKKRRRGVTEAFLQSTSPDLVEEAMAEIDFKTRVKPLLLQLNRILVNSGVEVHQEFEIIFPGHEIGMQYRLPTEAEWIQVATDEGRRKTRYVWGNEPTARFLNTDNQMGGYVVEFHSPAYLVGETSGKSWSVRDTLPVYINHRPIWDLQGHLAQLVTVHPMTESLNNPRILLKGGFSGKWFGSLQNIHASQTLDDHQASQVASQSPGRGIGFRLVRVKDRNL